MSLFEAFDRLFKWEKSLMKDFDKMVENLRTNTEIHSKNYSMSYHYETGMERPVIKVKGDVDQKELDYFIKRAKNRFKRIKLKEPEVKFIEDPNKIRFLKEKNE